MVDSVLTSMDPDFDGLYAALGRAAITPERQLVEQIHFNLLFVGLSGCQWTSV